jgi:hypothetical protein
MVILLPLSLIVGLYGMNGLDLTKLNYIPQDCSSPSDNGTDFDVIIGFCGITNRFLPRRIFLTIQIQALLQRIRL